MKNGNLLCFSYSVAATRKLDRDEIDELASVIADPAKKGVEGEKLVLKNAGKGGGYDILELLDNRIVLTCYIENAGVREKSLCLLKLLGVLAYFNDAYEIKMNSLYSPLTEALSAAQFMKIPDGNVHKELRQIEMLSNSNAVLAIELRKLNDAADNISEQCRIYKTFCTEVLKNFPDAEISTFESLGVDAGTTERVVKLLKEGA
jgi:hypothetical protein